MLSINHPHFPAVVQMNPTFAGPRFSGSFNDGGIDDPNIVDNERYEIIEKKVHPYQNEILTSKDKSLIDVYEALANDYDLSETTLEPLSKAMIKKAEKPYGGTNKQLRVTFRHKQTGDTKVYSYAKLEDAANRSLNRLQSDEQGTKIGTQKILLTFKKPIQYQYPNIELELSTNEGKKDIIEYHAECLGHLSKLGGGRWRRGRAIRERWTDYHVEYNNLKELLSYSSKHPKVGEAAEKLMQKLNTALQQALQQEDVNLYRKLQEEKETRQKAEFAKSHALPI